jgi:16S rRNA (adenine1518-N6/adenine1519-N6)-dimethyltransferase
LRLDLAPLMTPGRRVVGNLPYNISTPLLLRLLELLPRIRDLHFLLQKEVVDRLGAAPGSKDWGRLSVLTQYSAIVQPLFDVGPENFRPPPKVMSTFVRIMPRPNPLPLRSRDALIDVLRNAFQQRRKTLRNALQSLSIDWNRVGVDPGMRADAVELAGFVDLANFVAEQREHE